ncbi:MAG: ATP-binding cassette domain-containing protein [Firmicutes bacterium]|nr:ATP-binding cassette domain-containing protein [Bacillota bacterium]
MSVRFCVYKELPYFNIDVNYEFGDEILVIEGPSGSGKTTILNCISGIVKPDKGIIKIGDRIVYKSSEGINIETSDRNIGYVFQNYALFPNMNVKKNVFYGLKNKYKHMGKLEKQELEDYAHQVMDNLGVSHLMDKYPTNISGGEKQRVAFARALVTKPSLLLLDEPFSALDQGTKVKVYDEFAKVKEIFKIPTILITHNHLESELFADKLITLKKGLIE